MTDPVTRQAQITAEGRLPGDPDKDTLLAEIMRVNQAGEFGAKRIYEGQLAVLGKTDAAPAIRAMLAQEEEHLQTFNRLVAERAVRPTILEPVWHVAGFALGATTAFLGKDAAMACTVAVENVIADHYAEQAAQLGDDEKDLRDTITRFRDDEVHHRDLSLEQGAENAPAYPVLTAAISAATRFAILMSKKI